MPTPHSCQKTVKLFYLPSWLRYTEQLYTIFKEEGRNANTSLRYLGQFNAGITGHIKERIGMICVSIIIIEWTVVAYLKTQLTNISKRLG